jgi:hypothetical protein
MMFSLNETVVFAAWHVESDLAAQQSKLLAARSSLHRCLQRHGISRLPEIQGDKPAKRKFRSYPIGYFHLDIAEVQVERMNRTLKEATVQRYHYGSHAQLKAHIHSFLMAYNFAKRLKSLKGLTPYENICKIWTTQPNRFRLNPLHHTVGLNS